MVEAAMTIDEEVHRATKLLEAIMQASGFNRKELDKKLGAGPGYVSQVLTGRMELKMRHVLAILRALDVEPSLFFNTLYPEGEPAAEKTHRTQLAEFLKRFSPLTAQREADHLPPSVPPLDAAELERLVHSAVRTALAGQPSLAVS
jgi:transcriptional regulator with XRE-family HTH domain